MHARSCCTSRCALRDTTLRRTSAFLRTHASLPRTATRLSRAAATCALVGILCRTRLAASFIPTAPASALCAGCSPVPGLPVAGCRTPLATGHRILRLLHTRVCTFLFLLSSRYAHRMVTGCRLSIYSPRSLYGVHRGHTCGCFTYLPLRGSLPHSHTTHTGIATTARTAFSMRVCAHLLVAARTHLSCRHTHIFLSACCYAAHDQHATYTLLSSHWT